MERREKKEWMKEEEKKGVKKKRLLESKTVENSKKLKTKKGPLDLANILLFII